MIERRMIYLDELLELVRKNAPFVYHIVRTIAVFVPTIDAAKVIHARWDGPYCTNCNHPYDTGEYRFNARNYFPNCGAKMDGEL